MLRISARRWTAEERDQRIAEAPPFRHTPPSSELLAELVRQYTQITGDPIRSDRKRNLLVTCYRVHGDDTVPLIEDVFRATGTATNLLGEIRSRPPRHPDHAVVEVAHGQRPSVAPARPDPTSTAWAAEVEEERPASAIETGDERAPDAHRADCECPEADLLPGLLYCEARRPPFDGTSKRRWDRHPSNPDAARFFADEQPLAAGAQPR